MQHDLGRAPRRSASRTAPRVAHVDVELAHVRADAARARTATGAWARPGAGRVTLGAERLQPQRQPRALEAGVAGDEHAPAAPEVGVDRHEGGYLHAISSPPARTPPARAVPAPPARAEILGIPLAISDYEEVIDWMDAMIAAGARGYVTAAAVNLVMSRARGRRDARGGAGRDARGARRPAAGVGAARARPRARDARLRPRPDGALLRARGAGGHADVPVRRAHARGAGAARSAPARALSRAAHRRRLLAAVSRADGARRSRA